MKPWMIYTIIALAIVVIVVVAVKYGSQKGELKATQASVFNPFQLTPIS